MLSNLISLGASEFSPMGIEGLGKSDAPLFQSILQTLTPSAAKPIVEVAFNINFTGAKIKPTAFTVADEEMAARSQQYYRTVNPAIKWTTDKLFTTFGGDIESKTKIKKDKSGLVPMMADVSPEYVEHVISGYFGGTGDFLSQIVSTVHGVYQESAKMMDKERIMTEDDGFMWDNLPIVNKFVRTAYGDPVKSAYYNLSKRAALYEKEWKQAVETGNIKKMADLAKDPEMQMDAIRFESLDKVVKSQKELIKMETEPEGKKEMTKQMHEMMLKALDDNYKKYLNE
jgi:hypothetical protein